MSLKRIIKRCLKKDERAFDKLYHLYASKFWGISRRYANSSDEADDILQESFIKIFNNLEQLKEPKNFEAWGKRIVINTALYAVKQKRLFDLSITDLKEEVAEENESRSLELMDDMDITDLIDLMDHLPTGYKTILNLYAVEDFTHKQIADILNIKEATSRSQYFKAKNAFQKIIIENSTKECYERFVV